MGRLSATDLGLEGLEPVDNMPRIEAPFALKPLPVVDYPD
jgi:hypothetical protein